jgi:hypothetical protein
MTHTIALLDFNAARTDNPVARLAFRSNACAHAILRPHSHAPAVLLWLLLRFATRRDPAKSSLACYEAPVICNASAHVLHLSRDSVADTLDRAALATPPRL